MANGYLCCNDKSGECTCRSYEQSTLFVELYKTGRCKFKKPNENVTNGVHYSYNPKYTK